MEKIKRNMEIQEMKAENKKSGLEYKKIRDQENKK